MAAERDAVKRDLRDRVDRFMAGGKPELVSDPEATALAVWLGNQSTAQSADFAEAFQLLGWIHLCRNGILGPGSELPDVPATAQLLVPIHRTAPETLPTLLLVTVELIADLPPYRKPEQLVGKALNLMNDGVAKGDVASVAGAINLFLDAVAAAAPDHPDRASMLTNVCSGWLTLYELTRDPGAIDHAVRTGEEALAALLANATHRAEPLNNLGVALRLRFDRNSDTADLDRAIALLGEGIEHTPRDHVELAVRHNNLGIALGMRFDHTGDRKDLDRAIAALRQAGDTIEPHRPQRPGFLGDLAYFHWVRFERTGDRSDLEAAAESFGVAVTSRDVELRQRAQAYLEAAREELAKASHHGRRKRWWRRS